MLIYLLILQSFSGGGCVWGLGGGMGDWVGDGMLAGGKRDRFYKRNPSKLMCENQKFFTQKGEGSSILQKKSSQKNSEILKKLLKNYLRRIRYFWHDFSQNLMSSWGVAPMKIKIPMGILDF